ncbi:hypothetical protein NDS46_31065 (plasmid) [Paenibacillus thiaminolyticus]|uniref:hypothetical protein n=1 Tax=Paenibacillus thiaminolyticus TaxID=49283 RepID=UPI00232E3D6B|nr:hypothetical protein [Paenibacillus thiaminolyticus]WCF11399.1 hypothetical protein NDS46_31065 [Paenibacillus thiaminolyticus]
MMSQHVHSNEELLLQLQNAEKALKASEHLRMRAVANKGVYEQQLKDNDAELKALGTTADKAEAEIKSIDAQTAEMLSQINSMIPMDLLKKYNLLK